MKKCDIERLSTHQHLTLAYWTAFLIDISDLDTSLFRTSSFPWICLVLFSERCLRVIFNASQEGRSSEKYLGRITIPHFPFLQIRWPHGNGLGWAYVLGFLFQVKKRDVYSVGLAGPSQQYTPACLPILVVSTGWQRIWWGDVDTHGHSFIWHVCNADYRICISDNGKRRKLVAYQSFA
jgi:hypothetical protein